MADCRYPRLAIANECRSRHDNCSGAAWEVVPVPPLAEPMARGSFISPRLRADFLQPTTGKVRPTAGARHRGASR